MQPPQQSPYNQPYQPTQEQPYQQGYEPQSPSYYPPEQYNNYEQTQTQYPEPMPPQQQ